MTTLNIEDMKKNDRIFLGIIMLFVMIVLYYFLLPNRNWFGKPYLESVQDDGFAVVELFTSEGCSSCPPADDLLAKFQKQSVGKNIYLLAYHVDYWNHLDWKDLFSSAVYTERQQEYANRMKSNLIYTPQFIVNGTSEFAGDDERKLYRLVSEALSQKPQSTLGFTVTDDGQSLSVEFKTKNTMPNDKLLLALVQKSASSDVKRGENGGHLLHHVQLVRDLTILPLDKNEGTALIPKPEGFNAKDWELVGFIQNNDTGAIGAAATINF